MTYIVERAAHWAVDYRREPIAPEVLHHAKRAVIDLYAAMLPGSVMEPAVLLEKAFREELGHGSSRLVSGGQAHPRLAALINGTAAHALEIDDIFKDGIYHPGAPTIPAALALAQSLGATGGQFLRAVIVGYEISTRIGGAMGKAHYKYWHNTGTIGVFGAAAACAELLQLDAGRFAHALATVATFSAALQQSFRMDSMSKPLHAGRAAEAGMTAALAAREGVIGSLDVIEGEAGFGVAMSNGPDWDKAFSTLGQAFNICRMTFKNHTCCGHTFAAIDGALALQERMKVAAKEIERIRVGSYRAAKEVSHYEAPQTAAEGRFSLKYVVATALTHGSVRLAAFEPERMNHPETRALMQRIDVAIDPELDAAFPHRRSARVEIRTRDGRSEQLLQPNRVGDPESPLSDAQLDGKYLEFAVPVLGESRAKDWLARLWTLEQANSLAV